MIKSKFILLSAVVIGVALLFIGPPLTQAEDKPAAVESESNSPENDTYENIRSDLFIADNEKRADTAAQSGYLPALWCADISDEVTRKSCWEAYTAGLNYYQDGLHQRLKVFWWNHLTTKIIFFTVLSLVFLGVYFSWIQFKRAQNDYKAADDESHSVEISTSGIKVSSPVLGVIILSLSLAFFYLYLVHVYPVKELF